MKNIISDLHGLLDVIIIGAVYLAFGFEVGVIVGLALIAYELVQVRRR